MDDGGDAAEAAVAAAQAAQMASQAADRAAVAAEEEAQAAEEAEQALEDAVEEENARWTQAQINQLMEQNSQSVAVLGGLDTRLVQLEDLQAQVLTTLQSLTQRTQEAEQLAQAAAAVAVAADSATMEAADPGEHARTDTETTSDRMTKADASPNEEPPPRRRRHRPLI